MLYGAVGVRGGIFLPFPAPTLPCAPADPQWAGCAPSEQQIFKGRLAGRPPPLTSLPPRVSRPGGTQLPWEAGASS